MIELVELHVHSTFSIKDGFGTPEDIVKRAKILGHSAVAITDHHNTSAHPKLEKACREHGIKPIFGCEFYIVPNKAKNQRHKNHVTCLAKNLTGYLNILKLASLGYRDGNFYYYPTIDLRDLMEHKDGIIVLDGCVYGLVSELLVADRDDEALQVIRWFVKNFREDFYLEIQPFNLESAKKIVQKKVQIASRIPIPLVATNDVHFPEPGQEFIQNFLHMVRVNGDINNNQGTLDPRCHMTSPGQMLLWFKSTHPNIENRILRLAVENTVEIANKIEFFQLPKALPVKYPVENSKDLLLEKCREGWVKRGFGKMSRETQIAYRDRFLYEIGIISEKDFIDYFLVVEDAVEWAKSDKPLPNSKDAKKEPIIVGPARGSAAGSLTSYLLGITEIDPIRFNLLFERFIDITRPDPPDIDIDFENDRRDEVKEYLRQKYGVDHVNNISGYGTWGGKSLLDDIGRCYNIPRTEIDIVKADLVDNGGNKTVKQILEEKWPELVELHKVEGMIRNLTIHAAGVVVSTVPLHEITTVGRDGILLDKRDVEHLNLLKIDALSLKTLTIIKHVLQAINKDSQWLYSLPLDDELTLQGFNEGKFMGVFQFEGSATKSVCNQLDVRDFDILVDITSLSRPGPLQSGATRAYIENFVRNVHPIITAETAKTRGQVLYQEQMMRILRAGGLNWKEVASVRKITAKKEGYEGLDEIKNKFILNFDNPNIGEEVWHATVGGGGYGFNISHACSYTHITYYTMYLKKHYPLQFYWGNMLVEPTNKEMLREFKQTGGRIYGVKFGRSNTSWSIDRGGLRAGYLTLHGIGPTTARKLMDGKLPDGKVKEILDKAGAFTTEEDNDYLGLEQLKTILQGIPHRNPIETIQPGDWVIVAGRCSELHYKNLKEFYAKNGKDYSEVKEPEKCIYANMKLHDETGEIVVAVNRFMYADKYVARLLANSTENDVFVISGQRSKDYERIHASNISIIGKDDNIEWNN